MPATSRLFKLISGALGQIAINIKAVAMAGESPCPRGERSNSSAATGMPTHVVSNTRSSQSGLCFSCPNGMAGGWSPNATITRNRASEIKVVS